MPYRLRCSLWLPLPRPEVFRFFEDPWNLPRITPPWLGFRIVTERIELKPGCLIDYTVRWGIPMQWRTLIEAYEPPRHFIDRQLKGPYRLWRHEHTFTEEARPSPAVDGPLTPGTRIDDEVLYTLPFGSLGCLTHWAFVRRNLTQIFQFRQRETARLLLGERACEAVVVFPVIIERGG
jgi:ligand-binding SRPBCC domain-containing protein